MARRRYKARKSSFVARAVGGLVVACGLAGVVGFGFAFAGVLSADYSLFASTALSESGEGIVIDDVSDTASSSVLSETTTRDISASVEAIEAEEEAARLAAEEAARIEEEEHIASAEAAKAVWEKKVAASSVADELAELSDVDWSVGKDAFIAEWTERIDDYLAGSELEGQGATFAAAAWEYGVDPRWSPAIANTESSRGKNCFESYNAWGWMDDSVSWSSWEEAIYAHVEGLAEGYGYSLTLSAAKTYCPPTYESWFSKTLGAMKTI